MSTTASTLRRPRLSRYSQAVSPAFSSVPVPPQSITTACSPSSASVHAPCPTSRNTKPWARFPAAEALKMTAQRATAQAAAGASGRSFCPFPRNNQARANTP